MPEIVVKHNVKDAKAPERDPLPTGLYHAIIAKVTPGVTQFPGQAPRQKLTLEYTVTHTAPDSLAPGEQADKYAGRSVYQDYVIEPGDKPQHDAREAFRMQQLMAATTCAYKTLEGGMITFNTDHLLGKPVKIQIGHRVGKPPQGSPPGTEAPRYERVDRVDSATEVKEEDLV